MTFFSEYSRIKYNFLKAAYSFVMPYTSYEKYQSLLINFKLNPNTAVFKIPAAIEELVSEYLVEENDLQTQYDTHTQDFIESASQIYDHSMPVLASAILKHGYDNIPENDFLTQFGAAAIAYVGIDAIQHFSEAGFNFGKLHSDDVERMVIKRGIESIKLLSKSGVKFGELTKMNVVMILKCLGIESIKPLSEAGVMFSEFSRYYLARTVEILGIDSIKPFAEAGVKFSDLPKDTVQNLVKTLGTESVQSLLDAGVKPDVMKQATDTSLYAAANTGTTIDSYDTVHITGTQLSSDANIIGSKLSSGTHTTSYQLSSEAHIIGSKLYSESIIGSQLHADAKIPYYQFYSSSDDDENEEESGDDHAVYLAPAFNLVEMQTA